jgi:hypothetical protein
MTNYQIIKDQTKLNQFIEWLPELLPNECYYLTLFARKKYTDAPLKSNKAQLKSVTVKKEHIVSKIRQMEVPLGAYQQDGLEIPNEALALYISVNPRNMELAAKKLLIKLANVVTEKYNGYNPRSLAMSEIHQASGTKHFFDFDFDGVDLKKTISQLEYIINQDCLHILKTRGGFHILVELKKIISCHSKTWHKNLSSLPGVDVRGDNLIPVPGCQQGGFIPYFVR